MENHNYLHGPGKNAAGSLSGTFDNKKDALLKNITVDTTHSECELVLSYPVADGNAIILLATTDGKVASMLVLNAGTTTATIDTSKLNSGAYLLMMQDRNDRRVVEFNIS